MEVWFYLTYHHGLRGREVQCRLTKESWTPLQGQRRQRLLHVKHELQHQEPPGWRFGKYGNKQAGRIQCPQQVLAISILLQHLNPDCNRLFQRPRRNLPPRDRVWYENAPLGKNTLDNMMKSLSEKAGTSRIYTNHCLRATCVTVLQENGFSSNDIMSVTGHKNAQSLLSYSKPGEKQQQRMAACLDVTASTQPHFKKRLRGS